MRHRMGSHEFSLLSSAGKFESSFRITCTMTGCPYGFDLSRLMFQLGALPADKLLWEHYVKVNSYIFKYDLSYIKFKFSNHGLCSASVGALVDVWSLLTHVCMNHVMGLSSGTVHSYRAVKHIKVSETMSDFTLCCMYGYGSPHFHACHSCCLLKPKKCTPWQSNPCLSHSSRLFCMQFMALLSWIKLFFPLGMHSKVMA